MNTIDQKVNAEPSKTNQELILGLTLDEEIIQFNKECERLTGYIRGEVVHKKLSEILLPKVSIELWKTLLKSIQQTMWVDDFSFPIKTKHDQIYMISWTGFLIKDEKDSFKDICLFGKPLKTEEIHKQSIDMLAPASVHLKEVNKQLIVSNPIPQIQNEEPSMKQKKKKIMFAREKEIEGEQINNTLQVSEKKDRQLEKNHKHQEEHIQHFEDRCGPYKRKQKDKNLMISFTEQPKKSQTQQMYTHANQLGNYETQLMDEGKMLNTGVEEFYRRQELMKPTDVILERTSVTNQRIIFAKSEEMKCKEPVISDYHEILDKIPQSAAIVQRGILKQVNSSFIALLGYTLNEVVEKSFFDFITPDGLVGVEKYYLDRLKGESVSTYKTVFLTKDNNKIPVEVSIKQTMYNGEKAEIVIITCLEKSEPRLMPELVPKNSG
jgi:PAS domain S-box-containing protein